MLDQDRYPELYMAVAWAGAVIVHQLSAGADRERGCGRRLPVRRRCSSMPAFAGMGATVRPEGRRPETRLYADDAAKANPIAAAGAVGYEQTIAAARPIEDQHAGDDETCRYIPCRAARQGRSKGDRHAFNHRQPGEQCALPWPGRKVLPRRPSTYQHVAPMFRLAPMRRPMLRDEFAPSCTMFRRMAAQTIEKFKVTERFWSDHDQMTSITPIS